MLSSSMLPSDATQVGTLVVGGVWHWSPEKITLDILAAECRQLGRLFIAFYPFSDSPQPQGMRHSDNGTNDSYVSFTVVDIVNEALINFQNIDWKVGQLAE